MTKCPECGSYPERESYTFEGVDVHLYCCPNDCVVPDQLKRSRDEARQEWDRVVETHLDD